MHNVLPSVGVCLNRISKHATRQSPDSMCKNKAPQTKLISMRETFRLPTKATYHCTRYLDSGNHIGHLPCGDRSPSPFLIMLAWYSRCHWGHSERIHGFDRWPGASRCCTHTWLGWLGCSCLRSNLFSGSSGCSEVKLVGLYNRQWCRLQKDCYTPLRAID